MRLFEIPGAWMLLLLSSYCANVASDNFAAVSGTGWTDISQLQSTCSLPGYFVNPSDCSRFYICVDHSTAEKHLLLRYDFDCPAGLAFDEACKICNYPGPSGCIVSSAGGGCGGSGGGGNQGGGGGNGGWGWGWSKNPGIFQSTATVSRYPGGGSSWGTPGRFPIRGPAGTATIVHIPSPSPVPNGPGPTVIKVPITASGAPVVPSNPRFNLPIPVSTPATYSTIGWESLRIQPQQPGYSKDIFQSVKVTPAPSNGGGWAPPPPSKVTVIQSQTSGVKVTQHGGSVAWGSSKVIPVEQTSIIQTPRVTPVPQGEWVVTARPVPVAPPHQTVVQHHHPQHYGGGWGWSGGHGHGGGIIKVTTTPSPIPSNPTIHGGVIYDTVTKVPYHHDYIAWQNSRVTPTPTVQSPAVSWQGGKITQQVVPVPQSPPVTSWQSARVVTQHSPQQQIITQSTPAPISWQNQRISHIPQQQQQPVPVAVPAQGHVWSYGAPVTAANPQIQIPAPQQDGWSNVRFSQTPSGYSWQTNSPVAANPSPGPAISTGGYGVGPNYATVQQVISTNANQEDSQNSAEKSHIQLIYETKEKENENAEVGQSYGGGSGAGAGDGNKLQFVAQSQSQTQSGGSGQSSGNSVSRSRGPVYEIVTAPDAGVPRGRIIVLYAPFDGKGGKREVPVVEVQVEEREDENGEGDNDDGRNDNEGKK